MFNCEPCAKFYKTEFSLQRHQSVIHEGLKPYPCNLCDKRYTDATPLRNHKLTTHTDKVSLPCTQCSKIFTNKPNLDQHFRWNHVLKKKIQTCKYCQKSVRHLLYHQQGHENKEKEVFKCEPCDRAFSYNIDLKKHLRFHHEQNGINNIEENQCSQCGKDFKQKEYLLQHIKFIHQKSEAGKWICSICNKELSQYGALYRHKKIHLITNLECHICKKSLGNEITLKNHIQYVHSSNSHEECLICEKKILSYNFKKHFKIHSNEKKLHNCNFCDYSTAYKGNLKIHISRAHLKEAGQDCIVPQFSCSKCSKFVRNLEKHMRKVHNDEKYSCSECDYKANEKPSLTRHKRLHHSEKDFSCKLCPKTFKKESIFKHHIKMVHFKGKAIIECSFCTKEFTSNQIRRDHIKKFHKEKE